MENRKIPVRSRNGGNVFYQIPEENIFRMFQDGETKYVEFDELKKLIWTDGGEYLIKNSLVIEDEEAIKELDLMVEPEYFYSEKDIREILLNGSLDKLEDTLNFAPEGVITMIKRISTEIELPDNNKRKLIFEKTGFNIDESIRVTKVLNEDNEAPKTEETKVERKVALDKREIKIPERKVTLK